MNNQELMPYLNKFITVTLEDGTQRSGYVSNPQSIKQPTEDDPELYLVNGFFSEQVKLSRIKDVSVVVREETVSLPVVDLKKGFGQEP